MNTQERAKWLAQNNATLIGIVDGINFYEDPIHGDETGMWAVLNGEAVKTDWFDLPEQEDVEPRNAFMNTYRRAGA